jgi:hypothetical protein
MLNVHDRNRIASKPSNVSNNIKGMPNIREPSAPPASHNRFTSNAPS